TTWGGRAPRSITVAVSAGGLATTLLAPLSSVALLSLAETTICADAPAQASADAATRARMRWVMGSPLLSFVGAPPRSGAQGHSGRCANVSPARHHRGSILPVQTGSPRAMKIVEIREVTRPIRSNIRNAYIDFSKMTLSLVAVVTDVARGGELVVGYGFNSNGRY